MGFQHLARQAFHEAVFGVFDVSEILKEFLKVLNRHFDVEIAGFALCYGDVAVARILAAEDISLVRAEEFEALFRERLAAMFPEHSRGKLKDLEKLSFAGGEAKVSGKDSPEIVQGCSTVIPLVSAGEAVGVISAASYKSGEPFSESDDFVGLANDLASLVEKLLEKMRREEGRLTDVISKITEGVYIIDSEGYVKAVNPKGRELMSNFCTSSRQCVQVGSKLCSTCTKDSISECKFTRSFMRLKHSGGACEGEKREIEITNDHGKVYRTSVHALEGKGNPGWSYVLTARDITEKRLLEKRILLSTKLAALGEMAGGIAHEINNPLQLIMANIELVTDIVSGDAVVKKRLGQVRDGVLRIRGIVSNLLTFAREQVVKAEETEVNPLVENSVEVSGYHCRKAGVRISLDLCESTLRVKCNSDLFQQVITNLVKNAVDAIEESGKGGGVFISTGEVPGGRVCVEVADDGPGIPEDLRESIFEPFFTTKEAGKGTGLGLSLCRRFIREMGGDISVRSRAGEGTAFRITLPLKEPTGTTTLDTPREFAKLAADRVRMLHKQTRKKSGKTIVGERKPKCGCARPCTCDGVMGAVAGVIRIKRDDGPEVDGPDGDGTEAPKIGKATGE